MFSCMKGTMLSQNERSIKKKKKEKLNNTKWKEKKNRTSATYGHQIDIFIDSKVENHNEKQAIQ